MGLVQLFLNLRSVWELRSRAEKVLFLVLLFQFLILSVLICVYLFRHSQPLPPTALPSVSLRLDNDTSPIVVSLVDVGRGLPIPNVKVSVFRQLESSAELAMRRTELNGRTTHLLSPDLFAVGWYKLTVSLEHYFETHGDPIWYPEIQILFRVDNTHQKFIICCSITPYSYFVVRNIV